MIRSPTSVSASIETAHVCNGQSDGVTDGVHYKDGVYHTLSQIVANLLKMLNY